VRDTRPPSGKGQRRDLQIPVAAMIQRPLAAESKQQNRFVLMVLRLPSPSQSFAMFSGLFD
jgi:hypothetical protein